MDQFGKDCRHGATPAARGHKSFYGNGPRNQTVEDELDIQYHRRCAVKRPEPNLVVLPDPLHRLMDSHLEDPPDQNSRTGLRLKKAGDFEAALPRLLAHGIQTSSPASLFLAGHCCRELVMSAVRNGTADDSHDLILSCGVYLVSLFVDSVEQSRVMPKQGEPYGIRGDLLLVKAQWERDSGALDRAQGDYETAIRLGSDDRSNISVWKGNLASVETVRRALA